MTEAYGLIKCTAENCSYPSGSVQFGGGKLQYSMGLLITTLTGDPALAA